MSDHRVAAKRSPWRHVLLSVAATLGALLMIGGPVTGAYWADQSTVPGTSLTSGSLDITLRPGHSSEGGSFTDSIALPAAALSGMLPGDSRTFNLALRSDGIEAPLNYQVFGQSSASAPPNANVLGNALQTQIWITNGLAANPGGATTGYRTDQFSTQYGGTCPAGTQIGLQTTLSVTSQVLLTDSGTNPVPTISPGTVHNLCVRVALTNGVAVSALGKSTTVTLTFVARSQERS